MIDDIKIFNVLITDIIIAYGADIISSHIQQSLGVNFVNNKQKYKENYEKEHYGRFTLRLKKPMDDIVKDRAKDLNKSVNEYIVDLITADLDNRNY